MEAQVAGPELQQGTLDLLILRTLAQSPLHGWGISRHIRETSRDVLQVQQGSLYPALYRLEDKGLITAEWGISPEGRRARFYRLSAQGRRQLAQETEAWRTWTAAVNLVLKAT
jgi:transcriptional regulator